MRIKKEKTRLILHEHDDDDDDGDKIANIIKLSVLGTIFLHLYIVVGGCMVACRHVEAETCCRLK